MVIVLGVHLRTLFCYSSTNWFILVFSSKSKDLFLHKIDFLLWRSHLFLLIFQHFECLMVELSYK